MKNKESNKLLWHIIILLFIPLLGMSQNRINTKLLKAKSMIRTYMKYNIDDYSSYHPVSYSGIDSLFTTPEESEPIREAYQNALKSKEKAGLGDIDISVDISSMIKEINSEPSYDKLKALYIKGYAMDRDFFYDLVDKFHPVFAGWKLTHTYRAKNAFNATILYRTVFKFDKNMSKIISVTNIKDNEQ